MARSIPWIQMLSVSAPSFLTLFTCFIICTLYWRSYRRLSQFSGPRLASISRLHSVKAFLSGREHELMQESHERYGTVVRWQPNLLLINDPSLLTETYHSRSVKTPHYNASLDDVESLVEAKGWETHRNARRRISAPFSQDAICEDENIVDTSIEAWITQLRIRYAETGQKFNFTNWPGLIVAHMAMIRLSGHDYTRFPNGEDIAVRLIETFRSTFKPVHTLARLPLLRKFIFGGPLKRLFTPRPGDGSPIGHFLDFRNQLVTSALEDTPNENGNHLMKHLLHEARNTDGTKMSWAEIHDDLNGFLLNPPETTGHTILSIILRVSQNPSTLHNLVAEIEMAQKTLASETSPLAYEKLCTLPYLKACVREALRLDPGGVSYLPRWVKPDGWQLPNGQGFIPPGTEIASSPWVIGRNRTLYGDDADVFRPERWLEDPVKAEEYAKFDFAWGFGRRRCLGKRLALFAIYKVVFQFFLHFRLEIVSPPKSEAYMFWVHQGLQVRLHATRK